MAEETVREYYEPEFEPTSPSTEEQDEQRGTSGAQPPPRTAGVPGALQEPPQQQQQDQGQLQQRELQGQEQQQQERRQRRPSSAAPEALDIPQQGAEAAPALPSRVVSRRAPGQLTESGRWPKPAPLAAEQVLQPPPLQQQQQQQYQLQEQQQPQPQASLSAQLQQPAATGAASGAPKSAGPRSHPPPQLPAQQQQQQPSVPPKSRGGGRSGIPGPPHYLSQTEIQLDNQHSVSQLQPRFAPVPDPRSQASSVRQLEALPPEPNPWLQASPERQKRESSDPEEPELEPHLLVGPDPTAASAVGQQQQQPQSLQPVPPPQQELQPPTQEQQQKRREAVRPPPPPGIQRLIEELELDASDLDGEGDGDGDGDGEEDIESDRSEAGEGEGGMGRTEDGGGYSSVQFLTEGPSPDRSGGGVAAGARVAGRYSGGFSSSSSPLVGGAAQSMALQASSAAELPYMDVFRSFDTDGDELISYEAAVAALGRLGLLGGISERQLGELLGRGQDRTPGRRLYGTHEFGELCGRLLALHHQHQQYHQQLPGGNGVPPGDRPERAELLRRVYARYAAAPGQPRIASEADFVDPRMSGSQLQRLVTALGLMQPTGPFTAESVGAVYTRCKPPGVRKLNYPGFLRALGGLQEATAGTPDVWEAASQLGWRMKQKQLQAGTAAAAASSSSASLLSFPPRGLAVSTGSGAPLSTGMPRDPGPGPAMAAAPAAAAAGAAAARSAEQLLPRLSLPAQAVTAPQYRIAPFPSGPPAADKYTRKYSEPVLPANGRGLNSAHVAASFPAPGSRVRLLTEPGTDGAAAGGPVPPPPRQAFVTQAAVAAAAAAVGTDGGVPGDQQLGGRQQAMQGVQRSLTGIATLPQGYALFSAVSQPQNPTQQPLPQLAVASLSGPTASATTPASTVAPPPPAPPVAKTSTSGGAGASSPEGALQALTKRVASLEKQSQDHRTRHAELRLEVLQKLADVAAVAAVPPPPPSLAPAAAAVTAVMASQDSLNADAAHVAVTAAGAARRAEEEAVAARRAADGAAVAIANAVKDAELLAARLAACEARVAACEAGMAEERAAGSRRDRQLAACEAAAAVEQASVERRLAEGLREQREAMGSVRAQLEGMEGSITALVIAAMSPQLEQMIQHELEKRLRGGAQGPLELSAQPQPPPAPAETAADAEAATGQSSSPETVIVQQEQQQQQEVDEQDERRGEISLDGREEHAAEGAAARAAEVEVEGGGGDVAGSGVAGEDAAEIVGDAEVTATEPKEGVTAETVAGVRPESRPDVVAWLESKVSELAAATAAHEERLQQLQRLQEQAAATAPAAVAAATAAAVAATEQRLAVAAASMAATEQRLAAADATAAEARRAAEAAAAGSAKADAAVVLLTARLDVTEALVTAALRRRTLSSPGDATSDRNPDDVISEAGDIPEDVAAAAAATAAVYGQLDERLYEDNYANGIATADGAPFPEADADASTKPAARSVVDDKPGDHRGIRSLSQVCKMQQQQGDAPAAEDAEGRSTAAAAAAASNGDGDPVVRASLSVRLAACERMAAADALTRSMHQTVLDEHFQMLDEQNVDLRRLEAALEQLAEQVRQLQESLPPQQQPEPQEQQLLPPQRQDTTASVTGSGGVAGGSSAVGDRDADVGGTQSPPPPPPSPPPPEQLRAALDEHLKDFNEMFGALRDQLQDLTAKVAWMQARGLSGSGSELQGLAGGAPGKAGGGGAAAAARSVAEQLVVAAETRLRNDMDATRKELILQAHEMEHIRSRLDLVEKAQEAAAGTPPPPQQPPPPQPQQPEQQQPPQEMPQQSQEQQPQEQQEQKDPPQYATKSDLEDLQSFTHLALEELSISLKRVDEAVGDLNVDMQHAAKDVGRLLVQVRQLQQQYEDLADAAGRPRYGSALGSARASGLRASATGGPTGAAATPQQPTGIAAGSAAATNTSTVQGGSVDSSAAGQGGTADA